MKKIGFAALFCCFFLAASAQNSIPTWKMNDYEQYIDSSKDAVLIINFWATFCKPCIAEIPGFIEVANCYQDQSVKLLLVSLDMPSFYPEKIQNFATQHAFTAPIVWLDETDADYFCPIVDSTWTGSIPATVIINTKTGYRKFIESEMDKETFEEEVRKAGGNY